MNTKWTSKFFYNFNIWILFICLGLLYWSIWTYLNIPCVTSIISFVNDFLIWAIISIVIDEFPIVLILQYIDSKSPTLTGYQL